MTFIRNRKTGEHAVDAWRRNYSQLEILFNEVTRFEDFMVTIANKTLENSIYGMVYRVTVGAVLSITDGVTDLYVISTYVVSERPPSDRAKQKKQKKREASERSSRALRIITLITNSLQQR